MNNLQKLKDIIKKSGISMSGSKFFINLVSKAGDKDLEELVNLVVTDSQLLSKIINISLRKAGSLENFQNIVQDELMIVEELNSK